MSVVVKIKWIWCRLCMCRTEHAVIPGQGIICLGCHPEADPRKEAQA